MATLMATHLGHGTFTLQLRAGTPFAANSEAESPGLCAVANRANEQAAVLVAANGDQIELNTVGTLCEENGPGTSLHYNGTYRIVTGTGTGRFLNAAGGGSLTATFERGSDDEGGSGGDSTGATFLKLEGTIRSR
jgi:hypothetical protein